MAPTYHRTNTTDRERNQRVIGQTEETGTDCYNECIKTLLNDICTLFQGFKRGMTDVGDKSSKGPN